MKKRFLSIITAITLTLSLFPSAVVADSTKKERFSDVKKKNGIIPQSYGQSLSLL